MIITNKMNLPETLVEAVRRHEHRQADYSVTEILNPPRIVHLTRRHDNEIVEDASDRLWALMGRAVHYILQSGETENVLVEEYMTEEILPGVILSGSADLYTSEKGGTVADFKMTSAWTIVYKSRFKDWTAQLNSYAYMFRKRGFPVHNGEIYAMLKDWNKNKALANHDYPQHNEYTLSVPIWSFADQHNQLVQRVQYMEETKKLSDDQLPFCTPEERWEQPTVYAVMKEGRKSAVKLHDSEEAARKHIKELGEKHYLEVRPGKRTRCEEYCPVAKFCNQYQQTLS